MSHHNLELASNFSALDWVIVCAYLLSTLLIGLFVKRYVSNMEDYVVADRAVGSYLGIATMIGTELGLVTIMFSAQKGYTGSLAAFHISLMAAVVILIVGLTGFVVVPLRRMQVMTIPEFYERRYGRGVRILGGFILVFSGIINMGLFLKIGSLFITGITGMAQEESELMLKLVMTALLALVLIYTILGGMVSVVITDYIQFIVLTFGLLTACYLAITSLSTEGDIVGGWSSIVDSVKQTRGEAGFNPLHEEGFGIVYVVWMAFISVMHCTMWQPTVLRACSVESTSVVRKMYAWSSIGFLVRTLIPCFLGICTYVYVAQTDAMKMIFLPDQGAVDSEVSLIAMPIFLSQVLPAGIIGIVTAGMLAAFMSTHDSYLLCWSSVLTQDVIAPLFKERISTRKRLLLTRLFIFLIGLFLLVWGLWYPLGEQDLLDYMIVTGAIYGSGATALLIPGIYWKRGSKVGAYLGLVFGFSAILGLQPLREAIGFTWLDEHWSEQQVSAVVGLSCTMSAVFMMVLGSLIFPDHTSATTSVSRSENAPKE
mgnify:CR=1 FL=1